MRVLLAIAVMALIACGSSVPSLDAEFRDGRSLLRREQYDLALRKALDGLSAAERSGNQTDLWRFRLLRADILMGQSRAEKTLVLLDGYGKPPAGSEWAEVRAHLLLLRGRASFSRHSLRESEDLLTQAAGAAKEAGSEFLSAEVLLRQAAVLVQLNRFEEARRVSQAVADAALQLHDGYLEASAIANMGVDLLTESRNDEAIPWFERAIVLFTTLGAGDSVARAQGNLGYCFYGLGDYDNALLFFGKAQEWFARSGNRDSQQIWIGNAGNVSYQLADYAAAGAAYKRALEIARQVPSPRWIPRWRNNLAATYLELGQWDAAETYNKEALQEMRQLEDKSWEPTILVNAARIEEGRDHPDRARELFRSALARPAADPSARLSAHAGLARTYIRDGLLREAEAEFRNTVGMIEERGAKLPKDEYKLSYLSSLIRFYREYVDFLITDRRPEEALAVAESSRSHVLEERSGGRAAVERHTAKDYRQLARQTQSVLLEYWLSPKQSYLWVISPTEIRLHLLPAASTMHPLIESYRAVITGGRNPLEAASETGQRLYEDLLAPVAEAAVKGSRFIIVPDGDLYSFPLESLPGQGDSRKYWIEQATVATAPSLNYLARQTHMRRGQPTMEMLAIGDPSSSSSQYPHLQYASQEMDSIQSSMHPGKTAILRGDAATPDSYAKAEPGRFGLIHFAAHATANSLSPLDSAVILSGPPEMNRLLARGVMAIPLSAELVTISACRSAASKTYAGEGPVGFAWAFLRAGAHNVIAGLWDLPDRSTAQLMSGLYRQLAAGVPVAAALRDAKLALIRSGGAYAKPLYWAPFQLYVGPTR